MIEVWQTCVGFPNYECSTGGRVRRSVHTRPGHGTFPGREMKPTLQSDGRGKLRKMAFLGTYVRPRDGKRRCHRQRVAVLVLTAFVGPRPSRYHLASHLDGDCLNDKLDNLAWETGRHNNRRTVVHAALLSLQKQNRRSQGDLSLDTVSRRATLTPRPDAHYAPAQVAQDARAGRRPRGGPPPGRRGVHADP